MRCMIHGWKIVSESFQETFKIGKMQLSVSDIDVLMFYCMHGLKWRSSSWRIKISCYNTPLNWGWKQFLYNFFNFKRETSSMRGSQSFINIFSNKNTICIYPWLFCQKFRSRITIFCVFSDWKILSTLSYYNICLWSYSLFDSKLNTHSHI